MDASSHQGARGLGARQYGAFAGAAVLALAGFALGDYALLAWAGAAVLACLGVALLNPRWGVLATALLGLASSGYLLKQKISPSGPSICNVSERINCDVVNSSPASELFGLPIALYGVGFFLGVALATAARPSPSTRLYQTVGVFALVGSVYSLYLGYESAQIGAVCAMCLTIYACNFLLVGTAFAAAPGESGALLQDLPRMGSSTAFFAVAATFVVTVLFGQTFVTTASSRIEAMSRPRDPAAPRPPPDQVAATVSYVDPRGEVALEGDEPLLGKPDARFQIVEFADFGCPHCAQAFPLLHQVVEQNPDVALRFRVFPLSGACNPALQGQDRLEVCRAAMAAQCAHQQGKFWEFAGLVFANQRYLAQDVDGLLAEVAKATALDFEKFAACMGDEGTLREVTEDAIAGARLQLPGTPAFFVKGVRGDGYIETCAGPEGVMQAIAAARDGVTLPPPTATTCDDGHGH